MRREGAGPNSPTGGLDPAHLEERLRRPFLRAGEGHIYIGRAFPRTRIVLRPDDMKGSPPVRNKLRFNQVIDQAKKCGAIGFRQDIVVCPTDHGIGIHNLGLVAHRHLISKSFIAPSTSGDEVAHQGGRSVGVQPLRRRYRHRACLRPDLSAYSTHHSYLQRCSMEQSYHPEHLHWSHIFCDPAPSNPDALRTEKHGRHAATDATRQAGNDSSGCLFFRGGSFGAGDGNRTRISCLEG